jgi:hypothetical protein
LEIFLAELEFQVSHSFGKPLYVTFVSTPESAVRMSGGGDAGPGQVFLSSKGSYFYDRPNSLLVTEPVLNINFYICGLFWCKIGKFGRNLLENRTLAIVIFLVAAQIKE